MPASSLTSTAVGATSPDPRLTVEESFVSKPAFSRFDRIVSYVILVCGLLTVVIGATQILTSHSLVPLWDEWTELDAIATAPNHHVPVSWLWSQHSEHRVVFYRLLLLADIHLFHGGHWIEFVAMLCVQLAFLAILTSFLRFAGLRGTLWRAIVGLAAFCLFCPSQWENFGWAFQISFLLPSFFLVLALFALLKYERSARQGHSQSLYVGISILAACAATYSNANGVVLWPLLVLAAIAIIPRLEVLASFIGVGIVAIASYLYHYVEPGYHSSPMESIRHPLAVFQYVAGFLGVIAPAWVKSRNFLAVFSGLTGLVIASVLTLWILTRPRREPIQVALLALLFFSVSTAFLAALGRVRFGLEQAFSSRYQTFNLLFWFSVVSLLLLVMENVSPPLRSLTLTITSVVMLLAFLVFPLGLKASRTRTQQAEAAATTFLSDVPEKEALAVLYDEPALLWRDADYFRQEHLFMFSDARNDQMGQMLSNNFRIGSEAHCGGQVTSVERLSAEDLSFPGAGPALRIAGVSVAGSSKLPIKSLLFVSGDRIVGYAASTAGSFSAKHSEIVRNKDSGKWLGFARVQRNVPSIDVYSIQQDSDTLCHLAEVGSVSIPRAE